ncbi:acylphosphatase [Chelativorans intermedius]|uniref:Acylphosphatase n=1 Tax=Chelativorans intermedius TaxID=515947 RepID=A0ABV6D6D5_9HYPH|nr:acylphosphatase [Chelativorans intermedius]MCT8999442.1 acylphosphatase [Chelativorans intermedius]
MRNETQAKRLRITGRVQGVNFRAWTKAQAEELDLRGWVRNEPDGAVAAVIAGPGSAVATMLERLRSGPPAASVAGIAVEETDPSNVPDGFAIRR